ncbi:hypothetical protein MMC13_002820 [Lambiella insularis]|nr:hypothetical protein [Lambiella insularis]
MNITRTLLGGTIINYPGATVMLNRHGLPTTMTGPNSSDYPSVLRQLQRVDDAGRLYVAGKLVWRWTPPMTNVYSGWWNTHISWGPGCALTLSRDGRVKYLNGEGCFDWPDMLEPVQVDGERSTGEGDAL